MTLPLLRFVADEYQDIDLTNTLIIGCQHITNTTYNLFEELINKGLNPRNVSLIGKCYSTNKEAIESFQKRGVHISKHTQAFDSGISFDEQFYEYIKNFCEEVYSLHDFNSFERILILDDGGVLLSFLHKTIEDCSRLVGIEQTSSGYERIKSLDLRFPVINVARSKSKLEIESIFIAKVIVQKIHEYLRKYELINPRILIVGTGYIGTSISNILKKEYTVSEYDIRQEKTSTTPSYKNHLDEFDLIIGATGKTVITPEDLKKLKKGTLLASVSSSDREFSAVHLRNLSSTTKNCHDNIGVNGITLLNCGFPINFNNGLENESREDIQFTRALLLASCLEAASASFPCGLVELNHNLQKEIVQHFNYLRDIK